MDTIFIYVSAAIFITLTLVIFGLIGPKWLRDKMKKFNRWASKSEIPPVDPYKPVDKDILK